MTVQEFIMQLRQLVLEHPFAAELPICVSPHGKDHRQEVNKINLNVHSTKVVIESEGHQK